MENANITRGKKWFDVRKKAEFEEDDLTLKWLPTQKSIVEDIKVYEESLKSKEKK